MAGQWHINPVSIACERGVMAPWQPASAHASACGCTRALTPCNLSAVSQPRKGHSLTAAAQCCASAVLSAGQPAHTDSSLPRCNSARLGCTSNSQADNTASPREDDAMDLACQCGPSQSLAAPTVLVSRLSAYARRVLPLGRHSQSHRSGAVEASVCRPHEARHTLSVSRGIHYERCA